MLSSDLMSVFGSCVRTTKQYDIWLSEVFETKLSILKGKSSYIKTIQSYFHISTWKTDTFPFSNHDKGITNMSKGKLLQLIELEPTQFFLCFYFPAEHG